MKMARTAVLTVLILLNIAILSYLGHALFSSFKTATVYVDDLAEGEKIVIWCITCIGPERSVLADIYGTALFFKVKQGEYAVVEGGSEELRKNSFPVRHFLGTLKRGQIRVWFGG